MPHHLPAIVLLTLTLLMPSPLVAAAHDTPAAIEVTGRGTVSLRPDRAVLTFTIETSAADADEAVRLNAARADKLMAVLKKIMDDRDRIATTQFQLYPVYEQKMRITPSSYRVRNTVRLETGRVDHLGAFIDAAAGAGSGRIGQLRFSHSREAELAREAAALAVQDARRIAEELARAAGVTITRVHRIRYTAPPGPVPMQAEMALSARATPIEVDDLTIVQAVTVEFLIE